ncbi:MAG: DUF6175 family protein [Flavobacteriales bacterium]|nr:DUF6175 family protein [Flavobacteriales bacterium]
MKKTLLFLTISIFTITSFAQKAKKPTIMVVPSDVWCNQNNFTQTFNNQGSEVLVPDYKKALQNDPTLLQVISQLNGMMAEKGFPLKNLESVLKSLEAESAEDAMRSSSKTGGELQTSPIDQLKMVAKADIWMQISYNVNGYGMQSIQFNLQGLDAYTNKQVATAVGNGEPSTGSVPELMQEAVNAHLDNFCSSLMDHFDDMFANGREVIMRIKVWDDWGEDLETEDYGDDELGILIEDWVSDNTVNGVYNLTTATENMMLFEQCRIPLFYIRKEKERAYDVRRFGSDLMKYLSKELEVESKRESDGLGKVTLFIGHK